MLKFSRNKYIQILEVFVWIFIISTTIVVVLRYRWDTASSILQYLSMAALLVSGYFYLKNRSLYRDSHNKAQQLMQKQRELRQRQKTIDLIFENSAEGIMILDQDKNIIEFSPGMEKISGYFRGDSLGKNAQQLLKFSAEKNYSLLPDMMFTLPDINKRDKYIENTLITNEGKIITVEASHTLIHDPKTNQAMALAVLRDITFEKDLVERDKEFITVTSHQLNTPLSIIRGYASLLSSGKAGKLSQKQLKFIKEIHSATEKMIDLTNNMLSISRIEQEKIKLDISDVNVGDLIKNISEMFKEKVESKKLKLITEPIDQNLVIMADQEKLKQAISNLIENSIKYTKKGRITLSVSDKPEVVDIMVSDTGIGIPEDEIEKIGTRFYRSQNAINLDNHGTGLGMFITRTIIEKHHGHFKIESRENSFTKTILTLPKKQRAEE